MRLAMVGVLAALALGGCATEPTSGQAGGAVRSVPFVGRGFKVERDMFTGVYWGVVPGHTKRYAIESTNPSITQVLDILGQRIVIVQGPSQTCGVRSDVFILRNSDAGMAHFMMPECGPTQVKSTPDGLSALFYQNNQTEVPRLAYMERGSQIHLITPEEWARAGENNANHAAARTQPARRSLMSRSVAPVASVPSHKYGTLSTYSSTGPSEVAEGQTPVAETPVVKLDQD